ncbi:hypothetical protein [Tsuneonella dongtanensis]|uniref:hypothetical protein n=1 Tax=Tsuneonella dongtanensis TaxID=692370 RepID=UPI0012ED366F|nr:hypothetical protein [Tsuneonella dongtanensis]
MPLHHPADGPPPRAGEDRLSHSIAALADAPEDPRSVFTRERQVAFLHALAASGAVRPSAASIGVSYRTVYRERRANAGFRRAWDAALLSARALHEDVLAARAIDGVEEVVWFRGEEVGRRVRYDSRLLLAHLARLDRLTEDARTRAFADDYEGALERFEAGIDDPAPVCPDCGEALPIAADAAPENGGEGEAPTFSPGLCDRCDSPTAKAAAARAARRAEEAAFVPCPDCGGPCLDEDAVLTAKDCQWLGNRIQRFEAARPDDAPGLGDFPGHARDDVEAEQMSAFEAGVERWWLVVPTPEGGDPDEWHYHDEGSDDF